MRRARHPLGAIAAAAALGLALAPGAAGEPPSPAPAPAPAQTELATFAGGCFWCVEEAFDAVPGVVSTTSGFSGGSEVDPSYAQVATGQTGHREVVRVVYDPRQVSYETLLEVFRRNVDPTDAGGQFCDRGAQYTTAVFVHGDGQRALAEAWKRQLEASGRLSQPVVTPILAAGSFYPAEESHQDYHRKNPIRYKFYKTGCGRERALQRLWGEER